MSLSPSKKQRCSVCSIYIRFLSKKIECSNCKLVTCEDHSVLHENSNHFCDNCEKHTIKALYFSEYIYKIKDLKEDLEYLDRGAKQYHNEACRKNDAINQIEKQIKSNQVSHQERVDLIESKIVQEQKKILCQEKLFEHLTQCLTQSVKSEKNSAEKLDISTNELVRTGSTYQDYQEDQQCLLEEIDFFRSKLRESAPLSRVKLISCVQCYKEVIYEYIKTRNQASIKTGSIVSSLSQLKPSLTQVPQNPLPLCKVCNII